MGGVGVARALAGVLGLAGLLGPLGAGLGGCAGQTTRRDEYYLIHGLTFQPEAGDGSMISTGREREVLRDIANASQSPGRGADRDR